MLWVQFQDSTATVGRSPEALSHGPPGWGLPSRTDAGLGFFDEFRKRSASGLGAKDNVRGQVRRGRSKPAVAHCPEKGTLRDDVGSGLQVGLPALAAMWVQRAGLVSHIVFTCECMFSEVRILKAV